MCLLGQAMERIGARLLWDLESCVMSRIQLQGNVILAAGLLIKFLRDVRATVGGGNDDDFHIALTEVWLALSVPLNLKTCTT